ncbi:tyrosine-type recombinase/integrase [Pediococcus siamensis]|uniref:tyrosine-type recombinase/integrase n=1 Tax=Pediococcus siamensis TaxID=381829 RepID=UPI0039A24580
MNYNVQPLRTNKEIESFKEALGKRRYGQRNVLMFLLGINTGLRMSDILKLKVGDVRDTDYVILNEQKTGKRRRVFIAPLRSQIAAYLNTKPDTDYLFTSRSGQKLTTDAVYKLFASTGRLIHRNDIGTHTLRKTFGYHYYRQTNDIATLMVLFNHSSEEITKRYIGITDSEIEKSLANFKLGL